VAASIAASFSNSNYAIKACLALASFSALAAASAAASFFAYAAAAAYLALFSASHFAFSTANLA